MLWGYQDDQFVVHEVANKFIESLFLFVDDGVPQTFLATLTDGTACHFYLSAFLGFWSELDEQGYHSVRELYADCLAVDFALQYSLQGCKIEKAFCQRIAGKTQLKLVLQRGTISMFEADPSDPHSDSKVTFFATEQENQGLQND